MDVPFFQIDAFSNQAFSGNPAAVIILPHWIDDTRLIAIAAENNLSETAFLVKRSAMAFELRWFTPEVEVDLCGHATLASAWVLFHEYASLMTSDTLVFHTQSGELSVSRSNEHSLLSMNFPSRPGVAYEQDWQSIADALGVPLTDIVQIIQARDTMVILSDEHQVLSVTPDFHTLAQLDTFAVMVTAKGDQEDFVSRFFAPRQGINEDPVTGSAHCTLAPYWGKKLNKDRLSAKQLSQRTGYLFCELIDDSVLIYGEACKSISGQFHLADD